MSTTNTRTPSKSTGPNAMSSPGSLRTAMMSIWRRWNKPSSNTLSRWKLLLSPYKLNLLSSKKMRKRTKWSSAALRNRQRSKRPSSVSFRRLRCRLSLRVLRRRLPDIRSNKLRNFRVYRYVAPFRSCKFCDLSYFFFRSSLRQIWQRAHLWLKCTLSILTHRRNETFNVFPSRWYYLQRLCPCLLLWWHIFPLYSPPVPSRPKLLAPSSFPVFIKRVLLLCSLAGVLISNISFNASALPPLYFVFFVNHNFLSPWFSNI